MIPTFIKFKKIIYRGSLKGSISVLIKAFYLNIHIFVIYVLIVLLSILVIPIRRNGNAFEFIFPLL